ncbi:MAG: UDP-N-acetylmuramoyl-tripeptide--D-alanyl-D-alanine ligase [Clostridia bacterium]|nr:UDP-N-acetylmuramoyl-tripeptide--D-alanyl-D-alanine ligase [Clostridia bacterium]
MKKDLREIRNITEGGLYRESDGALTVDGFFSDSRKAEKGKMFLALRGEKINGNAYIADVVKAGACALCDDREYFSEGCVLVPDVRKALQKLAEHYRDNDLKDVRVIGVTGSVGKTTTKDMVACALSAGRTVHKTAGNANSQIGLPITVLDTPADCDIAVVELGMSYKGEMERISRVAKPDISIITNIGHSHIENLGSREAIRDEKIKIAAFSKPGSVMLLNGDEPLLKGLDLKDKKVYYISVSDKNADCFACGIVSGAGGLSFTASIFGEKAEVRLKAIGIHYVMNALFSLAAAKLCGVDLASSCEKLASYESDGRRQYIYESEGHTVISDCYNAAPESMKAALSVLGGYRGRRRVAVLGDILELGEGSPLYHKELSATADENADVLVTFGELARNYAESFKGEVYMFPADRGEELKEFLKMIIRPGDVVLYKASNGMRLFDCIV